MCCSENQDDEYLMDSNLSIFKMFCISEDNKELDNLAWRYSMQFAGLNSHWNKILS